MDSQTYMGIFCMVCLRTSICSESNECLYLDNDTTIYCTNTIPHDLPQSVEKVVLENLPGNISIHRDLFSGQYWEEIQSLVIKDQLITSKTSLQLLDSCFSMLVSLEELHIHVSFNFFHDGCWAGLDSLNLLDLTNSTDVSQNDLMSVFQRSVLPNLKTVILDSTGLANYGFDLNEPFWESLEAKGVSYLDLSNVKITFLNYTAVQNHCSSLDTVIFRGVKLGNTEHKKTDSYKPCRIKYLDLSGFYLPMDACSTYTFPPFHGEIHLPSFFRLFSNVETLVFDNMCVFESLGTPHIFRNQKVLISSDFQMKLHNLSMNNNKLIYIDSEVIWDNLTLETLSLNSNDMTLFNPSALSFLRTLQSLDLSANMLEEMNKNNRSVFSNFIQTFYSLHMINMANNQLSSLPQNFFGNNTKLEHINLATNAFTQIHFDTNSLINLKLIDLSNNFITSFDRSSTGHLENIFQNGAKIAINNNPISCSKCDDLEFIRWLWTNKKNILNFGEMKCLSESQERVAINEEKINVLKAACSKPVRITIMTFFGALFLTFVCLTIFFCRRNIMKARRENQIRNIIRKLQVGDDGYDFLAFLSYSSDDSESAQHIIHSLQKHMKNMTQITRDLICIGDKHFRLGRPILEEFIRSVNMCAVIVFIVTESFCSSDYCKQEFFLASNETAKPVVLMIKENTNEEVMPLALKEMYKRNTRCIWSLHNGELKMKTTWENLCESLIFLAAESTSEKQPTQ